MDRSASLCLIAVCCLLAGLGLAGCSGSFGTEPGSVANAEATTLSGKVIGGQNPISGAKVSVYQVGTSGYGAGSAQLGTSVVTAADGTFSFPANNYTCPYSNTPTYVVATGGNPGAGTNANVALMAVFGSCSNGKNATVNINEVTTAAAVIAVGQFMSPALGAGVFPAIGGTCTGCAAGVYTKGLVNAMAVTYPQLVNNASGTAVANSTNGTLTITTEAAKLNTIANVLAYCINSQGTTSGTETTSPCGALFSDVNALGTATRPTDTIQAGLMMALYPHYNVHTVYGLSSATSPFAGLSQVPIDWTMGISYTTTTLGLGVQQYTSSNLDIDANGNIWFPSNKTGAVGLAYFSPGTTTFSAAMGATGLIYPQYVSIDTSATPLAWTTDLSSGVVVGVPVGSGSTTRLSASYGNGGPIAVDGTNSITLFGGTGGTYSIYTIDTTRASIMGPVNNAGQTNTLVGLPTGLGVPRASHYIYAGESYFGESASTGCYAEQLGIYGVGQSGTSRCSSGGAILPAYTATFDQAFVVASTTNKIYDEYSGVYNSYQSLETPEGIVADGAGNLWVANAGKPSVTLLNAVVGQDSRGFPTLSLSVPDIDGYQHGLSYGSTMLLPYGIGVDGSGNVWVSNASCVSTSSTACSATSFTLSEMVGAAAPSPTPLAAEGNSVHLPTN